MSSFQNRLFFFKPHNDNHDFQIVDLLQLSWREQESRRVCLKKIHEFNIWKKTHASHENSRTSLYSRVDSLLRRKKVQDAILFYRLMKTDRVRAFDTYMAKLSMNQFFSGGAQ